MATAQQSIRSARLQSGKLSAVVRTDGPHVMEAHSRQWLQLAEKVESASAQRRADKTSR